MDRPSHPRGRRRACEAHRARPLGALLLLRDEDDACPRETGPAGAGEIAALGLPFPVAYVLLKPEYEVLFLPCVGALAGRSIDGRPGLKPDATWTGAHWESKRDLKGWLSSQMSSGKAYKPTLDQLALTRMLDLDLVRAANVPSFATLERALEFLALNWGMAGRVYPPPA